MPRGEKVGDAYIRITSDGSAIDEGIRDGLRDADKDVKDAGDRHADTYDRSFNRGLNRRRTGLALARNLHRARTDPVFRKAADDLGRQISKLISKGQDDKWITRTVRDMHRLSDSAGDVGRSFGRHTLALRRFRDHVDELDHRLAGFALMAGRLTGKGNRNNFVNFFGSVVGGLTSTLRIIPKVVQGFGKLISIGLDVRKAFQDAEGGFTGILAGVGAGGKAFAPLIASATALGAALAVLVVIIGPLVSLMSGLAAAVTALTGSLSFAAVAGAGALAGALLPLAAGAGVVATALLTMNKAQKAILKTSFRPVTHEFSELGRVAREVLVDDIRNSADGLAPVIRGLRPLVRDVASAMGDVFQHFSRALQGSGFKRFRAEMSDFLPNAVRSLGNIFVNVFGGLGGLFRSLVPITNRFLNWLGRITGEFARWINSPAGQAKMIAFFDRAGDAAKSVGHFLREAVVALGTLLGLGAKSGSNIFDRMADGLRNFTNYLNANPGAVARWFEHGEAVAKAVGGAIKGIASALKALDSGTNRTVLTGIFKGVAALAKGAGFEIKILSAYMRVFAGALGLVSLGLGKTLQGIGFLSGNTGLENFGKGLAQAGGGLRDFALHGEKAIKTARDVGSAVTNASGGFQSFKASTAGLADSLDQVTGAATATTRELIRQKLISTGLSAATRSYGVSMRDLIGAATGNASSIRAVNKALNDSDPATRALRGKLRALGVEFNRAGKIVRTRASDLQTWGEALRGIKSKRVRVAIRETGMSPTITKFKQLIRQQHLTPRQVRIAAKALNVQLTQKQLRSLTKDAKTLDKQRPRPRPDVLDRPAKAKFKGLMADAKKFDRTKPRPVIDVNNRPALAGLARSAAKVRDVDHMRATPNVHVSADLSAAYSAQRLLNSLHDRSLTITTHMRQVRSASGRIVEGGVGEKMALGGIVNSLTNFSRGFQAGEAGAEAIVPLNRPLAQVDPSVRWLSALAQGKALPGMAPRGKVVNVGGLTLITPTKDPMAVAAEAVNALVAKGY